MLGPLQDNGGPTFTMAPLAGSPAVDAGFFLPDQPAADQRGDPRIQGPAPDIGAVEVTEATATPEPGSLVVTTLSDAIDPFDDQTGLRKALSYAAALPGDQAITFAAGLSGTFGLAPYYAALAVADPIGRPDDRRWRRRDLDALGASGVVQVASGTTATLEGLTITGGSAAAGGGIDNHGTLSLENCTVSGNTAGAGGGGIYNKYHARLTMTDCTVSGNTAGGAAGIENYNGRLTMTGCTVSGNTAVIPPAASGTPVFSGKLTMTGCTVNGNTAGFVAGGIGNVDAQLTMTGCTVEDNTAIGGGGIFNESHASMTIIGCMIRGNTAGARGGGGIWNYFFGSARMTGSEVDGNTTTGDGGGILNQIFSSLTLTGDTVAGNTAAGSGGGIEDFPFCNVNATDSTIVGNTAGDDGGGLFTLAGTLTLTNVTVAANDAGAAAGGGGIFAQDFNSNPARTTLTNTIVSTNTAGSPGTPDNLDGVAPTAASRQPRRLGRCEPRPDQEPRRHRRPAAGPLGDYGGPTQTMALLPGSPAIDAGNNGSVIPGASPPTSAGCPASSTPSWTSAPSSRAASPSPSPRGAASPPACSPPSPDPLVATVTANNPSEPVAGGLVTFTPPASGASATLNGSPATIGADRHGERHGHGQRHPRQLRCHGHGRRHHESRELQPDQRPADPRPRPVGVGSTEPLGQREHQHLGHCLRRFQLVECPVGRRQRQGHGRGHRCRRRRPGAGQRQAQPGPGHGGPGPCRGLAAVAEHRGDDQLWLLQPGREFVGDDPAGHLQQHQRVGERQADDGPRDLHHRGRRLLGRRATPASPAPG